MATYTDNYNLEKPAQSDLYNIDVFNDNADIIDATMASKALAQNQATIESTNRASRNYAKGEFLVYNGLLYKVTAAISSGGTIAPGTNCVATNTGTELKALNDSLDALGVVTSTDIINATYGNIYFWKVGRIVYYWYGSGSITVASGDHQIGTIPESFRPISTVLFPVWPNNASNEGYTAVNANGNVYVRTVSAMNYIQGSGCYISAS